MLPRQADFQSIEPARMTQMEADFLNTARVLAGRPILVNALAHDHVLGDDSLKDERPRRSAAAKPGPSRTISIGEPSVASVVKALMRQEAYRLLTVREGDKVTRMPAITTSWSRAERYNAVGQPQKPSPPRTRIFNNLPLNRAAPMVRDEC